MLAVFDEDVPRGFGEVFREFGWRVLDVRDEGLRGASDEAVFQYAVERRAVLVTGDLRFINPMRFDLTRLSGIILNRLPQRLPIAERMQELRRLLAGTDAESLTGHITVFEVGRMRRRSLTQY